MELCVALVEIDRAVLKNNVDVPIQRRPGYSAAGYRSGSAPYDVISLGDADHRLPAERIVRTGHGVPADDGRTERKPGHEQRFPQQCLHVLSPNRVIGTRQCAPKQ